MPFLLIYASLCRSIIDNKMASNSVSPRSWPMTRAIISEFIVTRFVTDMRATIDDLVNNRTPPTNKSDDQNVSGYLASQMTRKLPLEGKDNKKKWRGKINNMLLRKDGAHNRSEILMRTLAPFVDLIIKSDPNPLVIFINKKSGGQIGSTLLERLKPSFPSAQVCDLSQNSASDYLRLYSNCKKLRVLICGGDGTVGWIMDEMKKVNPIHNCSFGIIPLGTGNDLCIQLKDIKQFIEAPIIDMNQKPSVSPPLYEQKLSMGDICTNLEGVRDMRISDEINKFERRAITNLLPNMVISDPKLLTECYENPKMVQLDRWSIRVERVYGRKRKLLKLLLIENRVKRRGNIIISGIIEFFTKIWKFLSNIRKRVDEAIMRETIKITNLYSYRNRAVDNKKGSLQDQQGQIKTPDREIHSSPYLNESFNANSSSTSKLYTNSNEGMNQNQNVNIKNKKRERDFKRKPAVMSFTMNNYLGVGVDGAVTLGFHTLRQKVPALFFSRWVNKLWYGMIGLRTLLLGWSRDLSQCCQLVCDGKLVKIPPGTQSIIILNINSYAGGMRMWPEASYFQGYWLHIAVNAILNIDIDIVIDTDVDIDILIETDTDIIDIVVFLLSKFLSYLAL